MIEEEEGNGYVNILLAGDQTGTTKDDRDDTRDEPHHQTLGLICLDALSGVGEIGICVVKILVHTCAVRALVHTLPKPSFEAGLDCKIENSVQQDDLCEVFE